MMLSSIISAIEKRELNRIISQCDYKAGITLQIGVSKQSSLLKSENFGYLRSSVSKSTLEIHFSLVSFGFFSSEMEGQMIQKIYPTPEELSYVCTRVTCPEENCQALFHSTSNLNMHLLKHHKITSDGLTAKTSETQYFCPAFACPYYKDSIKHFKKLKYLKQHFLKVHASKEFVCQKCDKKFSTETFRALHAKNCGEIFSCKCGWRYTSSEALLTHIKRKGKGHELLKKSGQEIKKINGSVGGKDCNVRKERLIYPKITSDMPFSIHYVAAVALSELCVPQNHSRAVDKGIQTEVLDLDLSKDQMVKCERKRKYSRQTQTMSGRNRKVKISTQTQTNNDYLKRRNKGQPRSLCRKRKKSMETQTKEYLKTCDNKEIIHPYQKQFPTPTKRISVLNNGEKISRGSTDMTEGDKPRNKVAGADEENARKWLWEMVSSSTSKTAELDLMQYTNDASKNNQVQYGTKDNQINQVFDLNRLCNIETQTDIDSFLIECNEDTAFTLCSTTETQTTDDFDPLLYSNMCTQTCEDVDQLFNFNFVHNETQTAWPDLSDCELNS